MAQTTTAELLVKHPQWVAESTEGTTPTASPSFTSLGVVQTIAIKINGNFVDISQVADEDLITIIQGMQEYETQFSFVPLNATDILNRGFNTSNFGTPSGTVNETLSILFSAYLNGTENFIILKGSRVKDISLTMEVGKETACTVTFIHTSISTPGTSHGLTTPSFASLPSGSVLGWTDGGANPFAHNSNDQDCKKITVNCARNSKADYTLGNLDPHSSQPHGRRISGDFSVLWTTNTLETDFKAGTARTATLVIDTGVATLTLTGLKIVDYARDTDAASDEAVLEVCTFRALSCSIA